MSNASIRQTCLTAILAGKTNQELTVILKAQFPTSQAAQKPVAHIGWYRSWAKKHLQPDGTLVAGKRLAPVPRVTMPEPESVMEPDTQTELERKQQELLRQAEARFGL